MVNESFCDLCALAVGLVTYLRYTVLMSPKKDETAVHCCDPALSVTCSHLQFLVSKLFCSLSNEIYFICKLKTNQALINVQRK